MHPNDAAARQMKSGQTVSVRSKVGSVEVPLEISEEMMPGVVSIPHGWGHDRLGVRLDVAQQHAGESINDITDNQTVDALCGTAAFNGTWVYVETPADMVDHSAQQFERQSVSIPTRQDSVGSTADDHSTVCRGS